MAQRAESYEIRVLTRSRVYRCPHAHRFRMTLREVAYQDSASDDVRL